MFKSFKALARGYVTFDVNGQKFYRYSAAKSTADAIPETENASFTGLDIFGRRTIFRNRTVRDDFYPTGSGKFSFKVNKLSDKQFAL
jgi:hypothetical protein